MTSLLAGLVIAALGTLGSSIDTDATPSELHYSVEFDEATGSASLRCEESSTGRCTFWFGGGLGAHPVAAGRGTLEVGDAPAIVRVAAARPAYCAGPDATTPPKWPDCTHGPLGGALDRSATVDYRRQ